MSNQLKFPAIISNGALFVFWDEGVSVNAPASTIFVDHEGKTILQTSFMHLVNGVEDTRKASSFLDYVAIVAASGVPLENWVTHKLSEDGMKLLPLKGDRQK